jgi:phosphatidylglycerophosphate synthase
MGSKIRLRYIFRPLVDIIAKGFYKSGIKNPNIITGLMFFFAVLGSVLLILFGNLLLFGIFVFLTGIFDGVDGSLSRIAERASQKGAFLDSTMDRFSEIVIFFAIFVFCGDTLLWNAIDMKLIIYIAFFASLMISYSRTRGENIIKEDFDIGLMARSERLFYLLIASIISFIWGYFNELLFIYMWLVIGTVLFRFSRIYNTIKTRDNANQ